jgi:hypothetical protein
VAAGRSKLVHAVGIKVKALHHELGFAHICDEGLAHQAHADEADTFGHEIFPLEDVLVFEVILQGEMGRRPASWRGLRDICVAVAGTLFDEVWLSCLKWVSKPSPTYSVAISKDGLHLPGKMGGRDDGAHAKPCSGAWTDL